MARFLGEINFTLNSKDRQVVCLRDKSVIQVKFGTSFNHLMPESELMLFPWSHDLLIFLASSFTCSPKVPGACCWALRVVTSSLGACDL